MNETIQQKVTPSCVSAPAPRKVYVIGHKNPDTDSICSAIAYADIKRRTEEGIFEAKRAAFNFDIKESFLRPHCHSE